MSDSNYIKYRDYYRAYNAAYRKTEAFKASQRKYNQSVKGQQTRLNYYKRPEIRAKRLAEYVQWRLKNKLKQRCHRIFAKIKKAGLIKKEPCFICGYAPALAHHDSYSFPHRVWWLCDTCHQRHHVLSSRK